MKILITVLLSAALLLLPGTPVNNSETKVAHTAKAEQRVETQKADVTVAVAETPTAPEPPSQPEPVAIPESPDDAKAFIYFKESSNNPAATNYLGCYGLGQDCNGIVKDRCGADYQCQDSFFTDYMLRRYGTWQAAKSFWVVHNWW